MQLTKTDLASIDKLVNDTGTLIKILYPFSLAGLNVYIEKYCGDAHSMRFHINAESYACVRKCGRDLLDLIYHRDDLKKGWMCTYYNTDNRIYATRLVPAEQLYVVGKTSQNLVFVSKVLFEYQRLQDTKQKKW